MNGEAVTLTARLGHIMAFHVGEPAVVGGGMGRLPSPGVAWYRRKINIPAADKGKINLPRYRRGHVLRNSYG